MFRHSLILVCLTLSALRSVGAPQTPDPVLRTDRYIAQQMRLQRIPGISLGVFKNGSPIYVKSYGFASLELLAPVRPDTRFQIGSIGKQFTAVAVMLLVREHRLALDDRLSKYLPGIPPPWNEVTLRLMLNHQSGIPQLTPPERNLLDLHHDYSDEEYVQLATSLPLDFPPGTSAAYSDTAYVLLGIVINRVIHGFYDDLLATRVFSPLQMSRTRILSDTDIISGRASGYVMSATGALENQPWVAPALNRTADGSLYSTVQDLGRWDAALSSEQPLSQIELSRMWTVDALKQGRRPLYHYGYGWEINSLRGHRVIEYDGNWQGFQAAMARYQDRALTVVVLTNLALCRVQRMVHTVAGYFDPAVRHFSAEGADPAPALTQRFAMLLKDVARGASMTGQIAPFARTAYGPEWAAEVTRELHAVGWSGRLEFLEQRRVDAGVERVYEASAADMTEFFTVRYDAQSMIDWIDLYREY